MSRFFISYIELSPDLVNQFSDLTHGVVLGKLKKAFPSWQGFQRRFKDYSLGIIIVTDRGIDSVQVKGPTITRQPKIVDFSVFLPEKIELLETEKSEDIEKYLDLVFAGLEIVLSRYDVTDEEINRIRDECKSKLVEES